MRWALLAMLAIAAGNGTIRAEDSDRIGRKVEDFTLRDFRGKEHSLAELKDARLVVLAFVGTECPLAKLYAPRLVELAKEYQGKGVAFWGISSNSQDSITELASFARVNGIEFPILKDAGNKIADALGAQRTPEVFLLDENRTVRYWGRIDDQYGFTDAGAAYQLSKARRRDLAIAIDELLAGKAIRKSVTKVNGCWIGRVRTPKSDSDVTYSNQIARILNDRCVSCHRPGQIAPFPLRTYEETVGWAEMIREVVTENRMPPWHADPAYGRFENDCRLSDEQKNLFVRWVENGAPEGDPKQLPPPPTFTDGWMIDKPEQVVWMPEEYTVPAEGTVEYQRFVIDPGWTEDKWIRSIECRPGNPSVVHHIIVYLRPPNTPRTSGAGRLTTDWLAAYAPGLRVPDLPEDMARYAPAGSTLIFEVHYTPNGVSQKDKSYCGFVFADPKKVKREVAVKNAGSFDFVIPPHANNHRVESSYHFRDETMLISVSPHMHLRGKDFRYDLIYPDGKKETILWVPRYDFGWQTTYTFTEPMKLPKGTKMHCVAHFDNSADNLANPDPSAEVRWGEQTWEEMMFGWFEMALVNQDLTKPLSERTSRTKEFLASAATLPKRDAQLDHLASQCLDSQEHFGRFSFVLRDIVPQVDRVCVTYVDSGGLRLLYSEDIGGVRTSFRSSSTVMSTDGQSLADAARAESPVVHDDINKAGGSVMRRMFSRGIRSSLHVPIKVKGKPATLNFWSAEPGAFPKPAVDVLSHVAARIGTDK